MSWVERFYVWEPRPSAAFNGGESPDRLLSVIDKGGDQWLALTEEDGTLVGLCDEDDGTVVAQWTYDAHGTPISREDAFLDEAHGLIPPIGHQGLFGFEPGRPMEQTPGNVLGQSDLRPWKQTLYHNRARTYSPGQGRFLQRDPNGLGVPVAESVVFGGFAPDVSIRPADLPDHYLNGYDAFAYASANPVAYSDPTGLFIGGILGGLGGMSGSMEIQTDYNDEVVENGVSLFDSILRMFDAYAVRQMADMEWSQDWNARDDDYSRVGEGVDYFAPAYEEAGVSSSGMFMSSGMSIKDGNKIRSRAWRSGHGKPKHYMAMANEVINFMNSTGLHLKDVDIKFNKSVKDSAGNTVLDHGVRFRPDYQIIHRSTGNMLYAGEVGYSQGISSLNDAVDRIRRTLPSVPKPGRRRLTYPRRRHACQRKRCQFLLMDSARREMPSRVRFQNSWTLS